MNERIKALREYLNLSQNEFAEKLNLQRNSISLIENGKRNISDRTILSISKEFNANEEWLRTGNGEMFNPAPTDALDALAKEFNLSHNQYVFIEKFVNMKQETFNELMGFFSEVLQGYLPSDVPAFGKSGGNDSFPDIPDTPEELERLFPPVEPKANKETG